MERSSLPITSCIDSWIIRLGRRSDGAGKWEDSTAVSPLLNRVSGVPVRGAPTQCDKVLVHHAEPIGDD